MFSHYIDNCDEHDDCTVIVCQNDTGVVVWRSHYPNDVDPAVRLNIDYPTAEDRRA